MQQVAAHLIAAVIGCLVGFLLIGFGYMEFGCELQQCKGEQVVGIACLLLLVFAVCSLFVKGW